MKQKVTIMLDYIQPSLNKLLRSHYRELMRERDRAFEYAMVSMRGKLKFTGKKVKISYTLYFKDRAKHDYSNYGQKMLDDALVKEGIIDDDSDRVVVEETVKIRYDPKNPHTLIEIEEVNDKSNEYCQCGGSPCISRNTNKCVYCKKPIKPGVYY